MFKDSTTRTIFIIVAILIIVAGILLVEGLSRVPVVGSAIQVQEALAQRDRTFIISIKTGTPDSQALDLKSFIEKQGSVESVQYVSGAEALQNLREKYKDNPSFLQGLDQLEPSPLEGMVTVTVVDAAQKASLISAIKSADTNSIIDSIN